ncbi:TRAP transporter substrate-binding protein [Marinomonas sp. A79]|uniref:TRAP transporter substrate-binding protein n=1 Tax=Marinomonas vulgaris TaxID=2823372 RepID=A0ABS5HCZ9_9GAMM|nr:TRAP transporter substrate-binding protein [Marinomonas vulgaris]MBR7889527.1 TRAP transporter substrate-binding protein [Marinomonas vulgaris]
MLNLRQSVIALLMFMTVSFSASSYAQTVLRVATWLPPTDNQNTVVWPTWAKWVEEATEGRVVVKLEYGLGHPKTMFQIVEDGISDASFSFHGYVPGRFTLPQIIEMPGLGVNSEATSVALWRMYDKYFKAENEFEELEVLGLFSHGQGTIQSNFPVNSLDDLKGKKIRVGGGVQTYLAEAMEVTPVGAPATKAYEMLQQNVIDGIFMPMAQQKSLRLNEVTKYITIFPAGMYMGSFSMFINAEFMDSLSEKDQAAIRAVSGEKLSAMAGKAWDMGDLDGYKAAIAAGVEINEVQEGSALSEQFNALMPASDQAWLDSVADKNIDAVAVLKELRHEARHYNAGN